MICEIINPSDTYTIKSDDVESMQLATLILGGGKYGLCDADGETIMPVLLFGAKEWIEEQFGVREDNLANYIEERSPQIADCLDSVLIGSFSSRDVIEHVLSKVPDEKDREEILTKHHDTKRTSMNDIGARAKAMAKSLRDDR